MGIRIDATAHSAVALCSCGWRDVAASRRVAWLYAVRHNTVAHSYDHRVLDAASHAAKRAGR